MKITGKLFGMLVCAGLGLSSLNAWANPYPTKPVKIVIGFGTGSAIDNTMRLIGEKFQAMSGQPLIVEPHPGAAGNLAAEYLARSRPDGYTLLSGSVGMMTINNLIYPDPGYSAEKDFAPILRISRQHMVLAVNKNLPVNSFAEFIAYSKSRPGKVSYASFGAGTESHFLGVLVSEETGTKMVHVPYKGSLPAVTDLLGGHVDSAYMPFATVKAHVDAGRLKILGIASDKRTSFAPDVPTFRELGYPSLEAYAWSGLVAPVGTPAEVQSYLHNTFSKILTMPDIRDKLTSMGHEIEANTTDQFKQIIETDRQRWKKAIEVSGFTLDK